MHPDHTHFPFFPGPPLCQHPPQQQKQPKFNLCCPYISCKLSPPQDIRAINGEERHLYLYHSFVFKDSLQWLPVSSLGCVLGGEVVTEAFNVSHSQESAVIDTTANTAFLLQQPAARSRTFTSKGFPTGPSMARMVLTGSALFYPFLSFAKNP